MDLEGIVKHITLDDKTQTGNDVIADYVYAINILDSYEDEKLSEFISAAQFGNLLLGSNLTDYTTQAEDFYDIRAVLVPRCIFMPTDADQVASGDSILASCGAQFAIRAGGHMNFPGSNDIDGGILLALNSLTDIEISSDNSNVSVGPGNRWVDVYEALAPYGLYSIGGRMKTIGMSGLSLIGGFHYLTNKYGFAMDNVVSYDVVLSNGTTVVANVTSNADLFWALKGGANNFGVLTRFVFKTLPIPDISTTLQVFNESVIREFIDATVDLAKHQNPEIGAGSIITITYNTTTKSISAVLRGVQEGTELPPSSFQRFSDLPSVLTQNVVQRPLDWHAQLDSPFQMFRIQFGHKTMKADADQLCRMYEVWKAAVEDISDVEGLIPTLVLNTMAPSAMSVAKNNDIGNVWGLNDDEALIIWQTSTAWDKEESDLRVTNFARGVLDDMHAENQAKGLASEFIYMERLMIL
ncbi:FAD binding domain-containing protein [Colletotrichum gloeosporioides Cg-14]|uniref:FAD binding domain-containing protein n=1 Tax=Colletotrichum gloeosporioides (strain Cg-14) TaxID=1237896 RepID=T0LAT5_COLGC|nr:FAD binding domain-containing protein [Colletotrichum gloeosporioides Cg-14]